MSITLNYTTINDAEDKGEWSAVNGASNIADSDYPSKEGSQCVEFTVASSSTKSGIKCNTVTSFDVRTYEVGVWFMNPKLNADGDTLLSTSETGIVLRLYSGSNWADYNQTQHKDTNGDWRGGWLYLRASGAPGSEDANSGTWGTSQVASVDSIAVLVTTSGDNTGKNDAPYAVDWAKRYDVIKITGYKTGTTPWTMDDVVDVDSDKSTGGGVWGVVEKFDNFYQVYAGLEFGDGTNNGAFSSSNEVIYLYQSSSAQDYDITVKNHFTVTLGTKVVGTDATYAKDGSVIVVTDSPMFQLSTTVEPSPDFVVENGGVLKAYSSKVEGFNLVNLGSGGSTSLEFIRCDFFNNTSILFNSSGLSMDTIRFHSTFANRKDVGTVYHYSLLKNLTIFLADNGMRFNINATVDKYIANDNNKDMLVADGKTVILRDSQLDSSKIGVV